MQDWEWKKITLIICFFVMLREFRPVEPFFTTYLNSPPLNYTTQQINEVIYPIGTYSSLTLIVVIFLTTDYLRYKPIIIMDGIAGIVTYAMLFGRPTIPVLTIEQMFYGFFYSSDVACNTYLYAKIDDTSQYQKITGYVRASSLFGRFLSGLVSQIVVSTKIFRPYDLVYVSAGGMLLATIWSLFIPSVGHSIYFHRAVKIPVQKVYSTYGSNVNIVKAEAGDYYSNNVPDVKVVIKSEKLNVVLKRLLMDFKLAYTNRYVLKWSLWWAFAASGFAFVNTYSQVLWQDVSNEYGGHDYLMNGMIDSVFTILSAVAACFTNKLKWNWDEVGDWVLAIVSFVLALLTLYNYYSRHLWLIYCSYILFGVIYQIVYTIAQSEVAKRIERDSYALIFGFNLFLSLLISGILTFSVIEGNVIYFTMRQQFLFVAGYFVVIGVIFFLKSFINLFSINNNSNNA